jgi:hypothetical protein
MIAAIALASMGVGCAAKPPERSLSVREPGPAGNAAVFLVDDARTAGESARFEFTRRDQLLGARNAVPLLGTREWPEYLPYESPIRFRVWQQR